MSQTVPLVTIGIPTFERPALLARALASVSSQDYPNLQVIVSDNGSSGDETKRVVEKFKSEIAGLEYVRHERTVPVVRNFLSLLDRAAGPYFMWLADDDEVSANYVSGLAAILDGNRDVACAAAHWVLLRRERSHRHPQQTSSFPERSVMIRVLRFIWRADDAFFYGLHRTSVLRQASFRGYWWPNREISKNWAYVFLLDVVLRGRVLLASDPSVRFINHDYTTKAYASHRGSATRIAAFVSRRVNVHYLYWEKCGHAVSPLVMPLVIGTSLLSLLREGLDVVVQRWSGKK
jgi:glycosyltransferase involved in cell wall biosynthesis